MLIDPRIDRLAELLINHSTQLARGEHLLIETFDAPDSIMVALIRAARAVGGHPHVAIRHNRVLESLYRDAADENFQVWADCDRHRMEKMDAYIGVRGSLNVSEMSDVPENRMKQHARLYMKPVHFEERVNRTRWCVLRWPTPSMAQLADLSTEAFENFYFNVCTLDYPKMASAAEALKKRMKAADHVHIKGPGETDYEFSIKDIPVIPCTGRHNIPDGECFTAPVRDSVNGVVQFNTPTIYQGVSFDNVRLVFREGKVVEATSTLNDDRLQDIFETDEGARYVGEFAIGFNPYIERPMKDILFDEKIAGSLHFTPGRAYEDADNGNRSEIHWDLVLIQRDAYGGGTIAFDGEVIRKDGEFVPDDLRGLNAEALK